MYESPCDRFCKESELIKDGYLDKWQCTGRVSKFRKTYLQLTSTSLNYYNKYYINLKVIVNNSALLSARQ